MNEHDPFTMQPVRETELEGGGVWFDIVIRPGQMHRYCANSLYAYFMSTSNILEPLQRYALNEVELTRLDNTIDTATKNLFGCHRSASQLTNQHSVDLRTHQLHLSELAFFFEDNIRGTMNNTFAIVCSTEVNLSEVNNVDAAPSTTLTLSLGGEAMEEVTSLLGSSQSEQLRPPLPPVITSVELRGILRTNLRQRWATREVALQIYTMLLHLYDCAPNRAIDLFNDYILPSIGVIVRRMAIFDNILAMEFRVELSDLITIFARNH